jgi:biopolymer transport protein ExbD
MRTRRRELQGEDFQMAPMIDMVFLLLVFFMCVSSLSQAGRRTPVELPASAESKVPTDLSDRATVSLLADGTIFIGPERSDLGTLSTRLRRAIAEKPGLRLEVRGDRGVPFAEMRKVLRVCAEAGAAEIIYATHQGD